MAEPRWIPVVIGVALAACGTGPARPVTVATPAPAPSSNAPAPAAPVAPPARTASTLQSFADSLVALPQFRSAHWGILVVSPDRRDTLIDVNADRLVVPASNQKLVTGAVALAQLGAEYQWRTTFTRTGPIARGVLRGDIIVSGTGDPTVSAAMRGDPMTAFAPLVAALTSAGVTRIDGRLRSTEQPAFPGSPLGMGWEWDDLDTDYGAGVTELLFNEGFTTVVVTGCGKVGKAACVATQPLGTSPVIRSSVLTRATGSGVPTLTWWRDSAAVPGISLRGSIAVGDSMAFTASQPDDRATYLAAVTEALRAAGIRVSGRTRRASADARTDTVVVLQSLPLSQVLPAMLKPSQNQVAEMLYRTLALHATGVGSPDSARLIVDRQLTAWGVRTDGRVIHDGSGLSRHDYITPRALVQILDTMRRAPTFTLWYDALPIAGVDGSLVNRMTTFAQGRVHAKTGTLDKVRSLSGYVTTADGEQLIISLIANNFTVPTREIDRTAERIVERLVTMRRSVP